MIEPKLVITFSRGADESASDTCTDPGFDPEDRLELSQEPWEDTAPRESDFGAWLADEGIMPDWSNYQIYLDRFMAQCNEDGSFDCKIFVKKNRPDLDYVLETTNGTLSGPMEMAEDSDEFYRVSPSDSSLKLPWPIAYVIGMEWEGNTYDACGNRIAPPKIEFDQESGKIVWDGNVYGTLHVQATMDREYWILHAPVRDDATGEMENSNFAIVTAIWTGGIDQIEVAPPDLRRGTCSGGYGSSVVVAQDGGDDDAYSCAKREIRVDACSGELISDEIIPIKCPDGGAG